MIHYAHFCDSCGHAHKHATDECAKCGSQDITHAVSHAEVTWDDAADNARLDEIRAESAARYALMDYAVDQVIEQASIELPTYSDAFLRRKQAGG